ncbi:TlpA disulfide reductase family protein [Aestuariibaculum suncheonense]|uniref:Redoxin domain-containing protein n=1 Tax=Aestuariibaculum suncheonense TaxID=1028745 RepID=A0A8J6QQ49_9FLAO|nr:TlpA disulfide reductase family protein [Aestuariibaculum suncheonense]MBD0834519.1 redoxin domain-containing protein [Aestuariibaculum suncheonense]
MSKFYLVVGLFAAMFVGCSSSKKVSSITQEQLNQMDSDQAGKTIKQLLKSKNEEDYKKAVEYYNASKNKEQSREVIDIAVKKFPKGYYAARQESVALLAEKDPDLKVKAFNELREKFPDQNLDGAYFTMINFQIRQGNFDEAIAYQQEMEEGNQLKYISLEMISKAANLAKKDIGLDNLLKSEIAKLEKIKGESKTQLWNNDDQLIRNLKFNLAETYYINGKSQNAIMIIQELRNGSDDKTGALSLRYATMLAKCGSYEDALPVFENAVIEGRATEETKVFLERAYTALGRSNYQAYFDDLIVKMNESTVNHVKSIMINEPCPSFTLKDINGNEVTNEDLKGKTLVVDFWATWCGPCKASFPGMKAAADKYKNDEEVMFLFVHTFEKEKDPLTLAKNYLSENHYDFDLYMDYRNAETRRNEAATAFGIRSIPTKVVIDPKGNLRFKVSGFKSSKVSMVAELSAMIEMARD